MKELYIAPEAKLLCFAAQQKLASSSVDFDDLLAAAGQSGDSSVDPSDNDVSIDI